MRDNLAYTIGASQEKPPVRQKNAIALIAFFVYTGSVATKKKTSAAADVLDLDGISIYTADIEDFVQDDNNANQGTQRGQFMIDASVQTTGLHRGIFVDKNNKIGGGNHLQQAAVEAGFKRAVVVETDGDTMVVTKRRDFDLDDPANKARAASLYDNRVPQLNIQLSPEILAQYEQTEGVNLADFFVAEELEQMMKRAEIESGREEDPDAAEQKLLSDGSLLALVNVTIAEPRHQVERHEVWQAGPHFLICADVIREWTEWVDYLSGDDVLFAPYPGPFVALSLKAKYGRLVMVQPDPYIAGHILDRYAEIHGDHTIVKKA